MNNERRERLSEVKSILDDAYADLESIRDDEQDAFDNLPESFQYSEKGTAITDAVDSIENILSNIETAASDIDELIN